MKLKFNATSILAQAAAACILFSCGCAVRSTGRAMLYPSAPKGAAELRREINEAAARARPLKLKGRLTYRGGPDEKPRSCLAFIVADPSRKIRVKGYRSLGPTLFEAAADGEEFFLYTPSSGKISRPRDEGEEIFYRKLLEGVMDSLFLPPVREDQVLLMECTPGDYVLSVGEKGESGFFLKKKIWVDVGSSRVAGIIEFDTRGIPLLMTTMSDYREGIENLPPTPSRLAFFWPGDGATLEITLSSIAPAGRIPDDAFSLADLEAGE